MLRDTLLEAWTAMRYNRRRTALTMLGMAWGIATVVLLLAYGNGFGQAMTNIFASFGTKTMILAPGRTSMQAGGQKAGVALRFTLDDIDLLTTNVPQITRITPEAYKNASVQYDTRAFNFGVVGDRPNVAAIKVLETAQGRFFNLEDQMQRVRVAVLGSEAKEKLFSGRSAVGERIRINGLSFEVIGVLLPKMQEGDNDINRIIYVPFTTMGDLTDTHYLGSIWFNYEVNDYQGLERSVRSVMAIQHKFNPTDRRALLDLQPDGAGAPIPGDHDRPEDFTDLHRDTDARHRRRRADEYHAGLGDPAHARDRHGESAGLAESGTSFFQFLAEALAISFVGGVLGVMLAYIVAHSVGRLTLYSAMRQACRGRRHPFAH